MKFSDAIKSWDSAIGTPEMTKNRRGWPQLLAKGHLSVFRIEFRDGFQPTTIGMHPPHNLGEHDEKWRQITSHILQSHALNFLVPCPESLFRGILDDIWHSWEKMRWTQPFAEFYGDSKKSAKSGSPNDLVSRNNRPTYFDYSAQVGFMHRHEYVVSLACGYIDEDDHNRAADRDSDADSTERKQILAACQEMWTKRRAMKDIWDFLLMQRASEFPEVDFYGTVDPAYDFTKLLSNLNNGQKAALQKLRKMTGCVTSLQGPPGTGKTYWASHIVIPLVESAQTETGLPHRILAVAATNEQADKLAEDLRKFFSKNVDRDLEK
ncbi:hypothetical protein N7528_006800 [Penicillium herquei]|nr:hypothetical protein N7528_006800 [Penicillium herquei]